MKEEKKAWLRVYPQEGEKKEGGSIYTSSCLKFRLPAYNSEAAKEKRGPRGVLQRPSAKKKGEEKNPSPSPSPDKRTILASA